jgi:ribosomal protein S18 acetylase RimI-like enzyme
LRRNGWQLSAEYAGKIIGIITIRNFNTITRFYVRKDYWELGIGRKLWEFIKKEFIIELINKKIIVKSSNYALPIYKKFGFKQIEEKKCENGCYFTLLEYKMKNGA